MSSELDTSYFCKKRKAMNDNGKITMMDYTVSTSPVQRGDPASSCIGCGECLAKCPQQLDIPNLLAKVKETMGK